MVALLVFGCAKLHQESAAYEAIATAQPLILTAAVKPRLPSGRASDLKANTTWRQIGRVPQGDVLVTTDQEVFVQAGDMHEAAIVVANGQLVGFYTRVGRSFAPLQAAVSIPLQPKPQ